MDIDNLLVYTLDNVIFPVVYVNERSNIMYANSFFYKKLNIDSSTSSIKNISKELLGSADFDRWFDDLRVKRRLSTNIEYKTGNDISILLKVDAYYKKSHDIALIIFNVRRKEFFSENDRFLLRYIAESLADGIFFKDKDLKHIWMNQSMLDFIGKNKHEVVGKSDKEVYGSYYDDAKYKEMREDELNVIRNTKTYRTNARLHTNDKYYDVEIVKNSVLDSNSQTVGLVGICRDITNVNKLQKEIMQKEIDVNRYVSIIEDNVSIIEVDEVFNIKYASLAFLELSGFSSDDLAKGINLFDCFDIDKSPFYNQKNFEKNVKSLKKNKEVYYSKIKVRRVYDENRKISHGYTIIINDITNEKKLEELSIKDGLTSLYNRYYTEEYLNKLIIEADEESIISVIIIDIDKFKSINDTHGHNFGDHVLKKVSLDLSQNILDNCILGRWGGEEFLIVCNGMNHKKAFELAESLRKSLENLILDKISITASFGVFEYNKNLSRQELINCVDGKLYLAKKSGRNMVK